MEDSATETLINTSIKFAEQRSQKLLPALRIPIQMAPSNSTEFKCSFEGKSEISSFTVIAITFCIWLEGEPVAPTWANVCGRRPIPDNKWISCTTDCWETVHSTVRKQQKVGENPI